MTERITPADLFRAVLGAALILFGGNVVAVYAIAFPGLVTAHPGGPASSR